MWSWWRALRLTSSARRWGTGEEEEKPVNTIAFLGLLHIQSYSTWERNYVKCQMRTRSLLKLPVCSASIMQLRSRGFAVSILSSIFSVKYAPTPFHLLACLHRGDKTRGQWPLRPAAARALRNRHVMLYDFHYLGIYVHICGIIAILVASEATVASKWLNGL